MEAWYAMVLDIKKVLTGAADSDVHLFCCRCYKVILALLIVGSWIVF